MNSYNILLADNEVSNLRALERTLRSDYEVFSVTNRESMLTMMEQKDMAVVIANYHLASVDGGKPFEDLLEKYPDTVYIVVAAYADESLLVEAVSEGQIFGYVTNPWEPEEIRSIVESGISDYEVRQATKNAEIRVLLHEGVISKEELGIALEMQRKEETPLTDILLRQSMLSKTQLEKAKRFAETKRKTLREAVVALGYVSSDDLEIAESYQFYGKRKLTEIIIDLGYATEGSIYSCYALQLGIPYMVLSQFSIRSDVSELLPPEITHKYVVLPIDRVGKTLVVASLGPLSNDAKAEIEAETGLEPMAVCVPRSELREMLEENNMDLPELSAVEEEEEEDIIIAAQTIELGMDATIREVSDKKALNCLLRDISEDCAEATIIVSDPYIREMKEVELVVILPAERSPLRCTGKVVWCSEKGDAVFKDHRGFLAKIAIEDISKIDRRRLELAMEQKKAFRGSGYQFTASAN